MPPMERPPVSPQVQAQMGPPGGPNFGPGIGQAMQQQDKSQVEIAVSTIEKIALGVPDETFQTYAKRAIAILKVGAAMAQQKGPQSGNMGAPPKDAPGGAPQIPVPPIPGQMPG